MQQYISLSQVLATDTYIALLSKHISEVHLPSDGLFEAHNSLLARAVSGVFAYR